MVIFKNSYQSIDLCINLSTYHLILDQMSQTAIYPPIGKTLFFEIKDADKSGDGRYLGKV